MATTFGTCSVCGSSGLQTTNVGHLVFCHNCLTVMASTNTGPVQQPPAPLVSDGSVSLCLLTDPRRGYVQLSLRGNTGNQLVMQLNHSQIETLCDDLRRMVIESLLEYK